MTLHPTGGVTCYQSSGSAQALLALFRGVARPLIRGRFSLSTSICFSLGSIGVWSGVELFTMYYRLNNFTGRLIGSAHIQPYFPIGVNPLDKSDPPKIVYHDAKPVRQTSPRHSSTSTSNMYAALKKKQELFQRTDGLPVHLKGGPVDKVLFGITVVLCAIGTAYSLQTLYVLSYPKKA